jgi:hypothetical protein
VSTISSTAFIWLGFSAGGVVVSSDPFDVGTGGATVTVGVGGAELQAVASIMSNSIVTIVLSLTTFLRCIRTSESRPSLPSRQAAGACGPYLDSLPIEIPTRAPNQAITTAAIRKGLWNSCLPNSE